MGLDVSKTPKKLLSYYLITTLVVPVTFFLFLELATRTVSFMSGKGFTLALHELESYQGRIENLYAWHPFTGFIMRPENTFRGTHPYSPKISTVYTDQYGFLSPNTKTDLTYGRRDDEIRIAIIGGSTSAGISHTYEENWPGKLGNLLQRDFSKKKIRIINAGTPGFNTSQSMGNLSLRVAPFEPDIVIIYHAYNDLKAISDKASFRPDYSHIHKRPHGFYKKPNLIIRLLDNSMAYSRARNSYREMRKEDPDAIRVREERRQVSSPEIARKTFEQHMKSLVYISRSFGADVVLSSFATLHDLNLNYKNTSVVKDLSPLQQTELISMLRFTPTLKLPSIFTELKTYNKIIQSVARSENTSFVDNASLVPHQDQYFLDRVHFSFKGADQMAKNFYPVVRKAIQKRVQR